MRSNLYHILNFMPATEAFEMPVGLEQRAQQLVASGKLRINADQARNFVRYGEKTFTARELTDPQFAHATRAEIARHVAPALGAEGIATVTQGLRRDLKKARGVSAEKEIKVARVLVQAAHPAVIGLLLQAGTEVFVSYAHTVADLMEVQEWEKLGLSSGLQATASSGTAVYVSAGGDPFFEGEHKTYATDGFPALARMVVIAGQELGHFADLRRSAQGIVGRHALDANHQQPRADPQAAAARANDQRILAALTEQYHAAGLEKLRAAERGVAFYHTRLRYTPPWFFCQWRRFIRWSLFTQRCRAWGIARHFTTLPYHRHGDAIDMYLADMAFNLTPDAEAYRHDDPLIETSIIVLEAVARVPQQVHKWGHDAVAAAWPGLYRFYFDRIIPACIAACRGQVNKVVKISKLQSIIMGLRRRLRPRPDYYP